MGMLVPLTPDAAALPWFQIQQDCTRHVVFVICLVEEHILPITALQHGTMQHESHSC